MQTLQQHLSNRILVLEEEVGKIVSNVVVSVSDLVTEAKENVPPCFPLTSYPL